MTTPQITELYAKIKLVKNDINEAIKSNPDMVMPLVNGLGFLIQELTTLEIEAKKDCDGWSNHASFYAYLHIFDGCKFASKTNVEMQYELEEKFNQYMDDEQVETNSFAYSCMEFFRQDINFYETANFILDINKTLSTD